jgi:transketolase
MATLSQLINAKAIAIAKLAVRATTAAGSGHPTSALSLAHLIATLMYHTMRWRPEQPRDPGADRLVLSEGPCRANHLRRLRRPRCHLLSSRPS